MALNAPTCIGPGRPRDEALQLRRRDQIMDRAALVFAQHGYPKTDVQWIADDLKISKGTVYRYFPSKEELFLSTVRSVVVKMQDHIDAAKAGIDDSLKRIAVAVEAYLEFFKTHPQLVELLIQERAEFRGKRRSIYFELRDARRGPFAAVVKELMDAGRIRPMPVERVLDVLGDVLYGTMFTNHFAGRDKLYTAQAQDILDVVWNGILSPRERKKR